MFTCQETRQGSTTVPEPAAYNVEQASSLEKEKPSPQQGVTLFWREASTASQHQHICTPEPPGSLVLFLLFHKMFTFSPKAEALFHRSQRCRLRSKVPKMQTNLQGPKGAD